MFITVMDNDIESCSECSKVFTKGTNGLKKHWKSKHCVKTPRLLSVVSSDGDRNIKKKQRSHSVIVSDVEMEVPPNTSKTNLRSKSVDVLTNKTTIAPCSLRVQSDESTDEDESLFDVPLDTDIISKRKKRSVSGVSKKKKTQVEEKLNHDLVRQRLSLKKGNGVLNRPQM